MHVAEEEPQCVPQFFSELSFLFPPFFNNNSTIRNLQYP